MKTRILTFMTLLTILGILVVFYLIVCPFFPRRSSSDAKKWQQQVKELQKENNKLKSDNAKAENEVKKLKAKLSAFEEEAKRGDNSYLLSLFFKKAKFPYEMRNKSFNFYSDPSCKKEYLIKKDLTFSGWQDYPLCLDLESGETSCYISYSNEEGCVFSKPEEGSPVFNAIR